MLGAAHSGPLRGKRPMALKILSEPSRPAADPDAMLQTLRDAIEAAIPESRAEVRAGSPGHFEIRVVSQDFEGLNRVRQQQLVYAAIKHLMQGDAAPVHAIDRLQTELP